jgi:hypothetical protein
VYGLGAGLCLWAAAAGCGATAMDQKLGQQTFDYMIPANPLPPGTPLPSIACTDATVCSNFLRASGVSIPGLSPVCAANVCQADLKLTILYIIDASNDPAFTLGIAQGEADSMRDVKMTYGITSTVNLAINQIDVYVGPDGLRSTSDPNSIYLGTVGPIAAMSNIPDGDNYLLLEDGTPAHTAFVNYAKHPENKFDVLMVAQTPRLKPGDPIPSGKIEVRMVPIVTLLNR